MKEQISERGWTTKKNCVNDFVSGNNLVKFRLHLEQYL